MAKPLNIILNKAETKAELFIYGDIGGFWDDAVTANDVNDILVGLPKTVNHLDIRISSFGGDVFQGINIYNRLKNFKAKKVFYVDSIAASIASIIIMAGDEVLMGDGTQIMVHKPWTYAAGNTNDLLDVIDRLEDVENQLLSIYQKKTGLDRTELKTMLAEETYLDASQSIELGFATGMMEEDQYSNIAASLNPERASQWMRKRPKIVNNTKKIKEKADKQIDEILSVIEGIK